MFGIKHKGVSREKYQAKSMLTLFATCSGAEGHTGVQATGVERMPRDWCTIRCTFWFTCDRHV